MVCARNPRERSSNADSFYKVHFRVLYGELKDTEMPQNTALVRSLPRPALDALKQQGERIAIARKRRQQTQGDLAQRMNVDVRTLRRVEGGDPRVTFGAYTAALWALGL